LAIRGGDLKGIIQMAFEVQDFQISGAPGWTSGARYDIFAKAPTADAAASAAELRQAARRRLQTLLAERFQMRCHRETRQVTVYRLAAAKDGPKMTVVEDGGPNGGIRGRCGQLTGTNCRMASLIYQLSRELGGVVEDQTGLSGRYNFQLEYAPVGSCQQATAGSENASEAAAPGRPSIFAALQGIGLKLDTTKGPLEVIVVDRVERPSEN